MRPASARPITARPATARPSMPAPPKPAVIVKPPTRPQPVKKGLVKAVYIGINYTGSQYELAGCINDVTNMQAQMKSFFPTCTDFKMLTDTGPVKPTKQNILDAIQWLVKDLQAGQNVLFHYSGHGGLVRDTNGDEVSGYDSCIYPFNGTDIEQITDDEIRSVLVNKIPAGCKCFAVLDCCHSGTALDLRYTYFLPSVNSVLITQNTNQPSTPGTVIFLSGAQDSQVAADTADKNGKPCGALTMALLDTWKKWGAAIKVKYLLWDTLAFLKENNYSQVPNLCTGSSIDINAVIDLSN